MSTPIYDGGPAFPWHSDGCYPDEPPSTGMSLRDYFAGQAMCGIALWQRGQGGPFFNPEDAKDTAMLAYQLADAMLAAREAKP